MNSYHYIALLLVLPFLGFGQEETDTIAWEALIPDVVVTAQFAPTESRAAIHDIELIKPLDLAVRGAINVEQALITDPSIRLTQDAVLGSSLTMQGVGGEGVKVMIDGVPITGRLNGRLDLAQVLTLDIARIEIVKGPMSVSYGSDAMGGVINIITKKSQIKPLAVKALTQVETRGTNAYQLGVGYRFKSQTLVRLNGSFNDFNGWRSVNGGRDLTWNPKKQYAADALIRQPIGKQHEIRWQTNFFDEKLDNYGNIRRPDYKPYAFDDVYKTKRWRNGLFYEGQVQNMYFTANISALSFDRVKNTWRTDFDNDSLSLVIGQQDSVNQHTYHLRATAAEKYQNDKISVQIGMEAMHDDIAGDKIKNPDTNKFEPVDIADIGVFLNGQFQIATPFKVEVGLRKIWNTRFKGPFIPAVHLKYDWGKKTQLRASWAQGFRSPTLKELFLYFVDVNHYVLGNANLKPERSNNFQINGKYDFSEPFRMTLGLFYNRINNRIDTYEYIEEDGELKPVPPGVSTLKFAYFNLEDYRTHGGQLGFNWRPKQWGIQLSYALTGYYQSASELQTDIHRHTYAHELGASVGYTVPKVDFSMNVLARYNDKLVSFYPQEIQGETVTQTRTQDGYLQVDIMTRMPVWKNRIVGQFGVRNVLNIRKTEVSDSGVNMGPHGGSTIVPLSPGRSWVFGLTFNLN